MLIAEYDYETDIAVQREEAEQKGIEKGIEILVNTLREYGKSENEIRKQIIMKYKLTEKQAAEYLQ